MHLKQILVTHGAAGADQPVRQIGRVVRHEMRGQPMHFGRDDLGEKRRFTPCHVHALRIDCGVQGAKERFTVGSDDAKPSSIVIARDDHRCDIPTEGIDEPRLKSHEPLDEGGRRDRGGRRIEDVTRDEQSGKLVWGGRSFGANAGNQLVEEALLRAPVVAQMNVRYMK